LVNTVLKLIKQQISQVTRVGIYLDHFHQTYPDSRYNLKNFKQECHWETLVSRL